MGNTCKKVYQEKDVNIIKCGEKYFLVTGGKRLKLGPLEGERYANGLCGCT